jgi:hypothetical protein
MKGSGSGSGFGYYAAAAALARAATKIGFSGVAAASYARRNAWAMGWQPGDE